VDRFDDRRAAGRVLARELADYAGRRDVVVLALPRGGVPVGFEVARALGAPLDVFVVRKLGVPGHSELAMGALASGGTMTINERVVVGLGIAEELIQRVADAERHELLRRERVYRPDRPLLPLTGRIVLLVDDGLATGATMRAAVLAVRAHQPSSVVVAVPSAPPDTVEELAETADAVICPRTPANFVAVGAAYTDFRQTTDDEVRRLLAAAAPNRDGASSGRGRGPAPPRPPTMDG
jgi:predicted phosphoribosyltransferase